MRHFTDIKLRQQYENKCLNQRDKHAQRHQRDRREPRRGRSKARQRFQHLLVRKQVAEKTNAERKRTDQITDQLDRKDQRRNPPDWAGKMFQMTEESILLDADEVVVKKRAQAER